FRTGMVDASFIQARIIAGTCGAALKTANRQAAEEVLREMATDPHLIVAAVYDDRGRQFAEYLRKGESGPAQLEPGSASSHFHPTALEVFQPIVSAGKP